MNLKWTTYEEGARNRRADVLIAVAAAVALVVLLAGTSYAGKQTVNPWIALSSVDGATNSARVAPSLGSWVTFST